MLATKVICPHCAKHLKTSKPLTVGHRVLCSRCGRSFAVRPDMANGTPRSAAVAEKPARIVADSLRESERTRGASAPQSTPDVKPVSSPAANRQMLWIGIVLGGLLLLMSATVGLALFFATRKAPQDVPAEAAMSPRDEADVQTSDSPSPDNLRLRPPNRDGNVL